MGGQLDVVAATVAFGMGVDRAGVCAWGGKGRQVSWLILMCLYCAIARLAQEKLGISAGTLGAAQHIVTGVTSNCMLKVRIHSGGIPCPALSLCMQMCVWLFTGTWLPLWRGTTRSQGEQGGMEPRLMQPCSTAPQTGRAGGWMCASVE
jgi:hypothetical protein